MISKFHGFRGTHGTHSKEAPEISMKMWRLQTTSSKRQVVTVLRWRLLLPIFVLIDYDWWTIGSLIPDSRNLWYTIWKSSSSCRWAISISFLLDSNKIVIVTNFRPCFQIRKHTLFTFIYIMNKRDSLQNMEPLYESFHEFSEEAPKFW